MQLNNYESWIAAQFIAENAHFPTQREMSITQNFSTSLEKETTHKDWGIEERAKKNPANLITLTQLNSLCRSKVTT